MPKYVKVLRYDMIHHGFQYKEGLNIDTEFFDAEVECGAGMYFCKPEDLPRYLWIGPFMADVELPLLSDVWRGEHLLKADRIILKNIRPIGDYEGWADMNFCKKAVELSDLAFQYVKNQTDELCQLAIMKCGLALEYVKNPSNLMCRAAVLQNGCALKYITHQTEDICKIAVIQNGMALEYVKKKTEIICTFAVCQNPLAAEFCED